MNIQIVSDVHLEFGPLEVRADNADVFIAAGDIDIGLEGLQWLNRIPCPVIYVAGNHEYWGHDIDELNRALAQETRDSAIHFLERQTVTIDNTRFVGCTLWTDFRGCDALIMDELFFMMNDFRYITQANRALRPADLIAVNRSSREWLEQELSRPFDGKTVVVTHHAPLMRSWFYGKRDIIQYAYCNDLNGLMDKHDIDLWVHGHVHEAFDYVAHGARVVCNPRGYFQHREVYDFESEKIVSV